jgi:D-alanine-D-alanine ligase
MPEELQIVVLFGGRSVEHAVSIRSAHSVLQALPEDRFRATPVAIGEDGRWFTAANPLGVLGDGEEGERRTVLLPPEPGRGLCIGSPGAGETLHPDLVFPLVHGTGGEDGTLQGLLESAELAYAGSGVLASALAMDKSMAKRAFRLDGLPVLDGRTVPGWRWQAEPDRVLAELERWQSGALFVKPANGGSSVGVRLAREAGERREAIDIALRYDTKVLVEPALKAREVEVSILGNDRLEASVPGEIVPANDFYDYEAKYADERTRLLVPAPVPDSEARRLRELAIMAFEAIGGSGFGRVDFLLDRETGEPFVSEVNTIPGFTDVSMYPRLWEATGLGYAHLLARIIELGLERHRERRRLRRTVV